MEKRESEGSSSRYLVGKEERAALAKTRDQSVAMAQLLSAVSDWMRETTLCYQLPEPEEWLKTLKDIKTMMALW